MNIVWLRRDLRLHDHAALHAALQKSGNVQPVFIFDTDILKQFTDPKDARLAFIADALVMLDAQLRDRGGRLWVFHGKPIDIIPALGGAVFAAEDFEPATIARDKAVAQKTNLTLTLDHLLSHPMQISKNDGEPYKVYTPYAKAWHLASNASWFDERIIEDKGRYHQGASPLPMLELGKGAAHLLKQVGYAYCPHAEWPVADAQKRLQLFEQKILAGYATSRDLMGMDGTSRLSPYLRFGLVSVRECYRAAQGKAGAEKWIGELIWRDFYAMILFRFPESAALEFQPQTRGLKWENNPRHIEAWKNGMTGFPIIDAAMRQLKQTGWMHNRARMIVASFLTKDLLTDWRIGEAHFAQYLMDYELASNVGGWQWAASTGTDAQPYFRVFNPELQSERFDANGEYIRRYVPELAGLSEKDIHAPPPLLRSTYPAPVVDHALQKQKAIALFRR